MNNSSLTKNLAKNEIVGEKYIIGREIGKGGCSTVFECFSKDMSESFAVKRIPLIKVSQNKRNVFEAEVSILKTLQHDNIVKYVDTVSTSSHLFIILEYMENGSLAKSLNLFGAFHETKVKIFVAQILNGLKYLHEKNVIHMDVKCGNLLLSSTGVVKLADFGVSQSLTHHQDTLKMRTKSQGGDSVAGTPYWMAPEVIMMENPDTKCDIWSLGCVVVELMSTKPPYFHLPTMTAMYKIAQSSDEEFLKSAIKSILEREDNPNKNKFTGEVEISEMMINFLAKCFRKIVKDRLTAAELLQEPWVRTNNSLSSPRKQIVEQDLSYPKTTSPIKSSNTGWKTNITLRPHHKRQHRRHNPSRKLSSPVAAAKDSENFFAFNTSLRRSTSPLRKLAESKGFGLSPEKSVYSFGAFSTGVYNDFCEGFDVLYSDFIQSFQVGNSGLPVGFRKSVIELNRKLSQLRSEDKYLFDHFCINIYPLIRAIEIIYQEEIKDVEITEEFLSFLLNLGEISKPLQQNLASHGIFEQLSKLFSFSLHLDPSLAAGFLSLFLDSCSENLQDASIFFSILSGGGLKLIKTLSQSKLNWSTTSEIFLRLFHAAETLGFVPDLWFQIAKDHLVDVLLELLTGSVEEAKQIDFNVSRCWTHSFVIFDSSHPLIKAYIFDGHFFSRVNEYLHLLYLRVKFHDREEMERKCLATILKILLLLSQEEVNTSQFLQSKISNNLCSMFSSFSNTDISSFELHILSLIAAILTNLVSQGKEIGEQSVLAGNISSLKVYATSGSVIESTTTRTNIGRFLLAYRNCFQVDIVCQTFLSLSMVSTISNLLNEQLVFPATEFCLFLLKDKRVRGKDHRESLEKVLFEIIEYAVREQGENMGNEYFTLLLKEFNDNFSLKHKVKTYLSELMKTNSSVALKTLYYEAVGKLEITDSAHF
eukprot:snap_masked-scaffold_12-processed-gene-4.14-mRNA-1 protein AED:0.37 eAED:0.37 QI:0/0/0/0.33/1/1/3/0/928